MGIDNYLLASLQSPTVKKSAVDEREEEKAVESRYKSDHNPDLQLPSSPRTKC